jgi:integrase
MVAARHDGALPAGPDITLAELRDCFMSTRPDLANSTVTSYDYLWAKLAPHIGHLRLRNLRPIDLDHAYAAILATGVSANTCNSCHRFVASLLNQAVKWDLTLRNIARSATPPRRIPYEPRLLDEQLLPTLVTDASAREPQIGALIHLAATSGARRSELAGLRWVDVDLSQAVVRFEHQPDKDGTLRQLKNKRQRTVFLDGATVETLRRHRACCDEIALACGVEIDDACFVFSPEPGNIVPYNPQVITKKWRTLADAAGQQGRFHDLRHNAATRLIDRGVPPQVVAARLGHFSPDFTMRVYAHTNTAQERRAAEAASLPGSGATLPSPDHASQ